MKIFASEILSHIHPDVTCKTIRGTDGSPCAEISIEHLKILIANDHVIGHGRGRKLREIWLTVPPDVAFRGLGETSAKVKDAIHSDASIAIQRSLETIPKCHKKHHMGRCLSWPHSRRSTAPTAGRFIPHFENLTQSERLTAGGSRLRPPLRTGS